MKCTVKHTIRLKGRCRPYRRTAVCPVCRRFERVDGARIELQSHGRRWPVCPGCTAEWRKASPKRRAEMQAAAQRNVGGWVDSDPTGSISATVAQLAEERGVPERTAEYRMAQHDAFEKLPKPEAASA